MRFLLPTTAAVAAGLLGLGVASSASAMPLGGGLAPDAPAAIEHVMYGDGCGPYAFRTPRGFCRPAGGYGPRRFYGPPRFYGPRPYGFYGPRPGWGYRGW